MFIIVVGQDFHPMLQSLPDQHVHPDHQQSWPRKDFNPDLARISILTCKDGKDFFLSDDKFTFFRIHIVNDFIKKHSRIGNIQKNKSAKRPGLLHS